MSSSSSSRCSVSLFDCLDLYFAEEDLTEVACAQCSLQSYKSSLSNTEANAAFFSSFYVNNDKLFDALGPLYRVKVNATKVLKLSRLPEVLVLHLIRRVYDMVSGNMLKLSVKVDFTPVLDLSSYCWGHDEGKALFRLVSVVVHIGNADAGHYMNYTLVNGQDWFSCSDQVVRPVSVQEVLSSQAYMLFYQRIIK